jgi:hypothetical protein
LPVASGSDPRRSAGQLVRKVDIAFGTIQGQITKTLPSGCTPSVYLYSGNLTVPEDWNSTAPSTDTNQPLNFDADADCCDVGAALCYQFTALPPGTYSWP